MEAPPFEHPPDRPLGVTAGKFNPPHLGHLHLLEHAAAQVESLLVLVCDRSDQTLPAAGRAAWLADAAAARGLDNVVVEITADDLPDDDSAAWAARASEHLVRLFGRGADLAFTSEAYGDAWARHLGAAHVCVDPARTTVPVAATELRADLAARFELLVPAARAALTRRIVLVGPESTGKSTLAAALARELATCWVPEWARTYDAGKQTAPGYDWTDDEFHLIATQQAALEDALARRAGPQLICDTDALATCVWQRRYTGRTDPRVDRLVQLRRPALYLLCDTDLPWVDDTTRESADHRDRMLADFTQRLAASPVSHARVTGTGPARLASALAAIDAAGLRDFDPLV